MLLILMMLLILVIATTKKERFSILPKNTNKYTDASSQTKDNDDPDSCLFYIGKDAEMSTEAIEIRTARGGLLETGLHQTDKSELEVSNYIKFLKSEGLHNSKHYMFRVYSVQRHMPTLFNYVLTSLIAPNHVKESTTSMNHLKKKILPFLQLIGDTQ